MALLARLRELNVASTTNISNTATATATATAATTATTTCSSSATTITTPTGTPPLPPLPNTFIAIKTKSDVGHSSNNSNSNCNSNSNSLALHSGNSSFKSSGSNANKPNRSPNAQQQPPPLPMKNGSKQSQQQHDSQYQHLSYNMTHLQHLNARTNNTLDRKHGHGEASAGGDYCTQINPHYLQTFDSLDRDHYSVTNLHGHPHRSQSKSQIYSYGSSGTASDTSNQQQQLQHPHYHSSSNIAHIEHHYQQHSHSHQQQQQQQHQQQPLPHHHQHHSLKHTKHSKGHKNKHSSKNSKSQDDFKAMHKQQQQQQQQQQKCGKQQQQQLAHDELGNLLWQQQASELVEQYPCPLPPIRHCHAHTHGHRPHSVGELLSPEQRHQRDLFTGDLGIPEIQTHVGSMVHTFETLALQRRLAEAEQERDREQSKYQLRASSHSISNHKSSSDAKYSQVKRRSQELRQRLQHMQRQKQKLQAQAQAQAHPQAQSQHLNQNQNQTQTQSLHHHSHRHGQCPLTAPAPAPGKLINSCSTHSLASQLATLPRPAAPSIGAHSSEQLRQPYDDYRKNLFGSRVSSAEELQDETYIVNAAFDEIFANYGDDDEEQEAEQMARNNTLQETSRSYTNSNTITNTDDLFDDEHMLVSLSELDDDVFASRAQTASTTPTTACAGRTPKHSQKYAAPAPPMLQQRSSTLTNLFERFKGSSSAAGTVNKTHSEQQLQPLPTGSAAAKLHKYAGQPALNEEPDFNRGSTLSQSFVRQLKRVSYKQKRAPPAPPPKPRPNVAHVTPLRNALIFPKRSKSSNELLLDDLNVQARKYFRRSEHSAAV
ncbi:hypothetical protein AWZ03_009862 [Drosophila navojoa]|uniref:Uncharacterized protein n=1 Tax=Drosophila navojoa TaxID=7232 RepID=A0A484B4S7_DRONA|nr:hypothetical protein AWZ03_009862 [Drosophila navojoa]